MDIANFFFKYNFSTSEIDFQSNKAVFMLQNNNNIFVRTKPSMYFNKTVGSATSVQKILGFPSKGIV